MTRHSQDMDRLVGRRAAEMRQALGLSQSALAGRLGISFQQVQKYETGTNRISASRLFQLSEIFGCKVADLFPPQSDRSDPPAPVHPLLASAEGTALLGAFVSIGDLGLRRALSQIAVALAKA